MSEVEKKRFSACRIGTLLDTGKHNAEFATLDVVFDRLSRSIYTENRTIDTAFKLSSYLEVKYLPVSWIDIELWQLLNRYFAAYASHVPEKVLFDEMSEMQLA